MIAITLTDNAAARAVAGQLPLTLDISELNEHAELPKALPATASRPGTIRDGDVMLYGSTTLVLFYEPSTHPTRTLAWATSTIPMASRRHSVRAVFESCF